MLKAVADTHTIIWFVFANPRLSPTAKAFINKAIEDKDEIAISSITLAEIVYLIEKGRLSLDTVDRITAALDQTGGYLVELPFNRQIARTMATVERLKIPDLPDRIIAATAKHYNVPVISKDGKMQVSGVSNVW